jgi:2-methylisocitrate lyase-like PEP mutase family enzyme
MSQSEKASRLLALHRAEHPLVLIHAWEAASARIVEHAGFSAIATTSAGVANAQGYPDGQHIPWPEMLEVVRRIAEAVQVPVTADIESGFAADLQQLEWSLEQLIQAGAVGLNLEDAIPGAAHGPLFHLKDQANRIGCVRRIAARLKLHLVINARTDAYWQAGVEPAAAWNETVARGKAYLEAGADCIFVPGLRNPAQIAQLFNELKAPINILAGLGVPGIQELKQLGVKRVSYGSGPMRAAMGFLRSICQEGRDAGTYKLMIENAVSYDEMNALVAQSK